MEDRRRPRYASLVLVVIVAFLQAPCTIATDYYDGPAKGDTDGSYSEPVGNANLGFDDVVRRHDGYVKGETPTIPKTSFSCSAQPYNPGLYADMETNCQVYHVCFEDRQESFLCGPGTNFNQRILACDFWYNFDCSDSASFYSANSEIGKVPDTVYRPAPSSDRGTQQTQRPSFPSYPQQERQPDATSDYQPPRVSYPSPAPPPPPRPQPPRVHPAPSPPPPPPPPRRQDPPPPPPPRRKDPPPPPPPRRQDPPPPPPPRPQPPRVPQPSHPPPRVQPPSPRPLPPIQQEVDSGYDIPSQHPINIPPPRPAHPTPARPDFPPVVSPPRVTRPPVQHPVVIRRPDESSRIPVRPVTTVVRPQHPQSEIKGSDYRPPRPQQPRIPQPSQPADVGFPSFPSRPVTQQTVRPSIRQPPPTIIQQEHVDDNIPPPPPPPPRQPPPRPTQRPYVPPPPPPPPSRPPPPIQQEVIVPPPPPPPRQPQPSVIVPDQRRPSPPPPPPPRPQIRVTPRPPQPPKPRPVFPPAVDHPNANIKGGPGYRQPPPAQLPSYEPTRINHRPSGSSQTEYQRPIQVTQRPVPPPPPPPQPRPQPQQPINIDYRPPITIKQPAPSSVSPGYKRPSPPPAQVIVDSDYKPSRTPSISVAVRPQPVPDHPRAGIKGADYGRPNVPRQPPRVIAPATSVSTVKRPQPNDGYRPVGTRPIQTIKTTRPSTENQVYQTSPPPSPPRIKLPSQQEQSRIPQRQFPSPRPQVVDHPNANIKGGPGYQQSRRQPVVPAQPSRPVIIVPPSSPSTSIHRKTPPSQGQCSSQGCYQGQSIGGGYQPQTPPQKPSYPRGDGGYQQQQVIQHDTYQPERSWPRVPTAPPVPISVREPAPSGIKTVSTQKRPLPSQQTIHVKQPQNEYDVGSSYKRGPEYYPKPEFQQHPRPVSTPSRSSQTHQVSASHTRVSDPGSYPGSSAVASQAVRRPQGSQSNYPFNQVPGHQPPHQRQVFPHRDNPDHPNESIKGTNAYRPPPPASYQAAASEVQEQRIEPAEDLEIKQETESSSKLGDTGSD